MTYFRHITDGRIVTTDNAILINEYRNNLDFQEITEWAKKKISYIEDMHGKRAAEWESCTDDRKIYSNTYKMLHAAIMAVATINNNTVHVAMNNEIRCGFEIMAEIILRFK